MKLVLAFLVACLACSALACSASTDATVVRSDRAIMADTNLVCAFAQAQPLGQPWVDFTCTAVQAAESVLAQLPTDAGTDAAPPIMAQAIPGGRVLVHVPAARVMDFMATHTILPLDAGATAPPRDGGSP